jgi:DNA-binding CsgD family transcriptional regulator
MGLKKVVATNRGTQPSELISRQNLLALMQLMVDIAAMKADPISQRQKLIDGLQALFKTKFGWLVIADNWRPNRRVAMLHQVVTSDAIPLWLEYIANFTVSHPIEDDPYADYSIRSNEPLMIIKRKAVLPTRAAEVRYADTVAILNAMEIGDAAIGAYRTGPNADRLVAFSLHRDKRAPKFNDADYALIHLAIEQLRHMQHRGHLTFRPPLDADLSPRLQQVLERILTGKSPKEIATDLRLSVHTVREHLQRLYARYGVNSREDLTSKFLR